MSERELFERASKLFLEASRLPKEQVGAFLDAGCGGNEELKRQVMQLLEASGKGSVFASLAEELGSLHGRLRQEAAEAPTTWSGAGAPASVSLMEKPGEMIGRYRLLELIGEGGFGAVWVAEQREPVQRRVALKVIKAGMDTRQVVARFEQERQALAMMDHPNIAKVLDAGATAAGRPYFVMELCKGEPISKFCDAHRLDISERLALLSQVCSAVQHAHGKGVIHRDIKPSNVLVWMQDGRPMPKVIDFGIAKATSSRLTEKTLYTEHRQLIGTPEYMSPEQAGGSLDIDTRTDVYALGVLLYELLTGSTPFSSQELRSAAYAEIERIIREVDPPKPSTRLSQSAASLASVAASRRTEPARLGVAVRGELDWIVMKALEKDRARRYDTASSLAADIARYLAGEPVQAAPASRAYRARKFVRRNRGFVAGAAAVGAALVIGAAAFAWQAQVARVQRDRAIAAEEQTAQRADEVQKVADFQSRMLAQVDAAAAGLRLSSDVRTRFDAALSKSGLEPGERERRTAAFGSDWALVNSTDAALELINATILRPARAAVEQQFADQPELRARLLRVLFERYLELGLYDDAGAVIDEAVKILGTAAGADDPATIAAVLERCRLQNRRGQPAEAQSALRAVLETQGDRLGPEHPLILAAKAQLGESLAQQGKPADAEALFREVLAGRERALGEDHVDTLTSLADLASALRAQGKLVEAEPVEREALERRRRTLGEDHPSTLQSYENTGALLLEQGKHVEAEAALRAVLERRRRALGELHPDTLRSVNNLAGALGRMGKNDEAELMQRDLIDEMRRVLGDDHPETLIVVSNLATSLIAVGKLAEAEPLSREALERRVRVLGRTHPQTLVSYNVMAYLLRQMARPTEAMEYLREAFEVSGPVLGEDHPERIIFLINMGALSDELGAAGEAEAFLVDAVARSRRTLGLGHPYGRAAVQSLGDLLMRRARFADAIGVLGEAEGAFRTAAAERDDGALARLLLNLGIARREVGEFAAGAGHLVEAHTLFSGGLGPTHRRVVQCAEALVKLFEAWDAAEPGKGHDASAAQWREKLKAAKGSAAAPWEEGWAGFGSCAVADMWARAMWGSVPSR